MTCEVIIGTFILGGVTVPLHSAHEISQSYGTTGGFALRRYMNGGALKQHQWDKITTQVGGTGAIPPGLDELDFNSALLMSCIGARGITSNDNVVDLPAGRRSDTGFVPVGFARVAGSHEWVPTNLVIVVDEATLTPVASAEQYRVVYYPEITVFANPPDLDVDPYQKSFGWTITAEEV